MKYDLAQLTKRTNPGIRRKAIPIRDAAPPAVLATDLFRSCYLPVVELWEHHGAMIADEYARTLAEMTTDSIPLSDSPADLNAGLERAQGEFDRLLLALEPQLRAWTLRVERWQRGKWRGAVLSATGVDVETLIGPADVRETLGTYVGWNVDLIRDVSAQARQRISTAVFTGLSERRPAREVAAQIREATGMARTRSQGIAADQLSKITSELADERRREAGISVWAWRHSGKKHPRPAHVARNGHLYSDDPEMVGREVGGVTVEAPPPANDKPGRPPWCGCRAQAVLVLD